jgi:hypothetical protein
VTPIIWPLYGRESGVGNGWIEHRRAMFAPDFLMNRGRRKQFCAPHKKDVDTA